MIRTVARNCSTTRVAIIAFLHRVLFTCRDPDATVVDIQRLEKYCLLSSVSALLFLSAAKASECLANQMRRAVSY